MLADLGGKEAMFESPVFQEFFAERIQGLSLRILRDRFCAPPEAVVSAQQPITDPERLDDLAVVAARCPNLANFHAALGATED
jgi:hypothetical protein